MLKNVTLSLPGRGLVALVGESGSGKTTLLKLLLNFDVPSSGHIYLGGVPLIHLPDAELRGRVSYVPQSPDLLRGSLLENVRFGRACSKERVWAVLREVGPRDRRPHPCRVSLTMNFLRTAQGSPGGSASASPWLEPSSVSPTFYC